MYSEMVLLPLNVSVLHRRVSTCLLYFVCIAFRAVWGLVTENLQTHTCFSAEGKCVLYSRGATRNCLDFYKRNILWTTNYTIQVFGLVCVCIIWNRFSHPRISFVQLEHQDKQNNHPPHSEVVSRSCLCPQSAVAFYCCMMGCDALTCTLGRGIYSEWPVHKNRDEVKNAFLALYCAPPIMF